MSGDIHNLDYSERMKFLNKLHNSEHIIKAETKIVDNESDLRKAVKSTSSQEGAEGSYLKIYNGFPYELDGKTQANLKYKNTFSIDARIEDVHEVKGGKSWNYGCSIDDINGRKVAIGRTYNTGTKLKEGSIIKVSFCNLNKYFDTKTKKVWYNWWSPRFIMAREDKKRPDNIDTADKLVKASHGEDRNRKSNIKLDADVYMSPPDEDKAWLGMLHIHGRGKSVHGDLRFQVSKDWAIGWTLYIPKGLSKVPDSYSEYVELVKKEITPVVGLKLKDSTKRFNCGKKAPEPAEWLDYKGMVRPGEVGATKNEPGFFCIADRFTVEFGAQKCMVGKTQLIVEDEDGHIKRADIRSIVKQKRNVSVLTPTGFEKIKDYITIPVDFDALREIKLDNGSSIKCDDNHPSFCLRDNQICKLPTKEIREGDLIPIFSDGYDGADGDYNTGRFIGLYLAEGSIQKDSKQLMSFAFHERETEYISFIAQYAAAFGAGSILRIEKRSSGIHLELSQAGGLIGLIDQFVKRVDKSLRSNVFGLSRECRQGIVDGMHEGDNNDTLKDNYSEIGQGRPHLVLGKDMYQLLFSLGNVASLKYNTQHIRKYGTRVTVAYDLTNFTKGWWHQYIINGQRFIKVKEIKKLNKWDVGSTVKELFDVGLENDHRIVLANGIITSNSHYHEYFCSGGQLFNGRFCIRLLENKEEWTRTGEGLMTWMAVATKEKTPYVISRRAVEKKWVPGFGHSALPRKMRLKVPEKYRYWRYKELGKQQGVRDELVVELGKKLLSTDALGPAIYKVFRQTWKGPTVVREGPSRTRYYLAICQETKGNAKFALATQNNPLENKELACVKFEYDAELCALNAKVTEVPPKSKLNETKDTPSKIELMERGKVSILSNTNFRRFRMRDGKLKGSWIAFQREEGSTIWTLKLANPE